MGLDSVLEEMATIPEAVPATRSARGASSPAAELPQRAPPEERTSPDAEPAQLPTQARSDPPRPARLVAAWPAAHLRQAYPQILRPVAASRPHQSAAPDWRGNYPRRSAPSAAAARYSSGSCSTSAVASRQASFRPCHLLPGAPCAAISACA